MTVNLFALVQTNQTAGTDSGLCIRPIMCCLTLPFHRPRTLCRNTTHKNQTFTILSTNYHQSTSIKPSFWVVSNMEVKSTRIFWPNIDHCIRKKIFLEYSVKCMYCARGENDIGVRRRQTVLR